MEADDVPDHFSWEEVYTLYGIPFVEDLLPDYPDIVHDFIDDEQSSPGEGRFGPFPLTSPIEAFSN